MHPMTLEDLAALVQGEFRGPADTIIRGAASIERVGPDEITLADRREVTCRR